MTVDVPELGDRFVVRARLGGGGEAEVLRAWDRQLRREVTLKLRHHDATHGAIEREAMTLRALRPHAHLPVALDDLRVGDWHVLVMAYVAGTDLRELLRDLGSPGLDPAVALRHLDEAARALDHLHDHDPPICHGDVKPANIVIGKRRRHRTVLVDLGLAGRAGDVRVEGTGAYSPPEAGTTGRSPLGDVYSLAATAHALLTGCPPEPGAEADWSGVPVDAQPAVRAVLARGLSVQPEDRQSSASELVVALRGALREALPRRGTTGRRTARALIAAAALLPLLLLAGNPGGPPREAHGALEARRPAISGTPAPTPRTSADVAPASLSARSPSAGASSRTSPATAGPSGQAPTTPLVGRNRSGLRVGVVYSRAWILDTAYVLLDVSHVDDQGRLVTEQSNYESRPPGDVAVYVSDDLISQYAPATGEVRPVRVLADGKVALGPLKTLQAGYTETVGLGEGWLSLYDTVSGAAAAVRFDGDGNYLAQTLHTATLPAGYDALVRLATRNAMLYRSSDGATLLIQLAAGGAIRQEAGPFLPPGLVAVCDDLDGTVVGIDPAGRATSMRVEGGRARAVAVFDTGRPWAHCAPARRALLLFDGALGVIVRLDRAGRALDKVPLVLPAGSSLVFLGPRA